MKKELIYELDKIFIELFNEKELTDEEITVLIEKNDDINTLLNSLFDSKNYNIDLNKIKKLDISDNTYNTIFKYLLDNDYRISEDEDTLNFNLIKSYLNDVNCYPLLEDEKQKECFNKHYKYVQKTIKYKNEIINQYSDIICDIALKYSNNDPNQYSNIIKYELKLLNNLLEKRKELSKNEILLFLNKEVKHGNIYTKKYEIENLKVEFDKKEKLSDEQLHNLYIKLYNNEDERLLLKKYIAERNLKLVISIAKSYYSNNMSFEDCIQEGNIGLLRAIDKFDPTLGNKFSTYAKFWIEQSIMRALTDKSRNIRIPVHFYDRISKYKGFCSMYLKEHSIPPTEEQIMQHLNISKEELSEIVFCLNDVTSINDYVGEEKHGVHDEVGDFIEDKNSNVEETVINKQLRTDLLNTVDQLAEENQAIILLRFGLTLDKPKVIMYKDLILLLTSDKVDENNINNYLINNNFDYVITYLNTNDYRFRYEVLDGRIRTLDEVGNIFNVTRERIRQREFKSLLKLRRSDMRKKIRY